jgi:hypothetical protein
VSRPGRGVAAFWMKMDAPTAIDGS